jgi:hypothetical protein
MPIVVAGEVPLQSEIARRQAQSDYVDCRTLITKKRYSSALACYLAMVGQTPAWVNTMMAMRNKIVSFVGLKNLGHLGDVDAGKPVEAYQVGERVGIFTILYLSDEEVILGDNDRHLEVQLSMVLRDVVDGQRVTNTTVVHNHNLLGRFYMLFVGPAHKVIAPAVLRRLPVS